ncbi:hypothetical protein [Argonema antarcticum]|uniref:hypothetical protein n=1 Tax=Argonema antarcticum TaxID=2942763 RepID=UPI0020119146|nr:hypothetical protein [Argonema antarcticum]MCL1474335.1 hypothetical protein [Argonema antarcticum A004/B2]
MYSSLKTISIIAVTITTMGVMPSYGLQSEMSSDAETSSSAEASFSNIPGTSSQRNQTIPSTLLASYQCTSSLGQTISERADRIAYPGIASLYATISLPRWKNASNLQKCNLARNICDYQGEDNLLQLVVEGLGGTFSLRAMDTDSKEGVAVITASMQTLCARRYSEFIRSRSR